MTDSVVAYYQPPDPDLPSCWCQCSIEDHPDEGACDRCDCSGFREWARADEIEDRQFELADIAWKER